MDKKEFSERDICTKFITPALEKSGWDKQRNIISSVNLKISKTNRYCSKCSAKHWRGDRSFNLTTEENI